MVALPALTPVTTPAPLTVATDVLLLAHDVVPPDAVSTRVMTPPEQVVVLPLMKPAYGAASTLMLCVAVALPQLLVTVYVMVAVPADTAVTTPVDDTEAMEGLLLLHAPAPDVSVSVPVVPAHSDAVPLMTPAAGAGLMVMA
jgi:hypothetical protein